jgi:exopolyphosphatase/guanosine-5'-triphosphate,3'-diphosphate pyrophosphatase
MPRSERVDQPIIHPGRVDVIAAGALIWERVMTRVSAKSGVAEAVTAEHDILDGIALGLL